MKLLPTNTSTVFTTMDNTRLVSVLEDCFDLLRSFLDLYEVMQDQDAYESKHGEIDDFEMERLDVVEDVFHNLSYDHLKLFAQAFVAGTDGAQRRVQAAVHYIEQSVDPLREISLVAIDFSTEKTQFLEELSSNVLGELVYFIKEQFQMVALQESIESGKEISIDVALHMYLDTTGRTPEWAVSYINGIYNNFKPILGIFEEYPELEEEFYDIAGVYVRDFEVLNHLLTHEIVVGIIEGRLNVQKTILELEEIARRN